MPVLWSTILGDLSTIAVIALIVIPVVWKTVGSAWYQKQLGIAFDRKLRREDFDYTRLAQNSAHYIEKRHLAYAEVYRALIDAEGHVFKSLQQLVTIHTFDDYSSGDIRLYLEKLKVPGAAIQVVEEQWDSRRSDALGIVRQYEEIDEERGAADAYNLAHNAVLSSVLYMSEETENSCMSILKDLWEARRARFSLAYRTPERHATAYSLATSKLDSCHDKIANLRISMRSELRRGYLEDIGVRREPK